MDNKKIAEKKINQFKFFLDLLKEAVKDIDSLNRIKVLKLLFIWTLYLSKEKKEEYQSVFWNYLAMKYWAVEYDFVKFMNNEENFDEKLKDTKFVFLKTNKFSEEDKEKIKLFFNWIPKKFLHKTAGWLIEFTHIFKSWQTAWHVAQSLWMYYYPINYKKIESINFNNIKYGK